MKKLSIAFALVAATVSSSVFAQAQQRDMRTALGPYVGGALGAFGANAKDSPFKEVSGNKSKNRTGFKLFSGYQLTENFGVELGALRSSEFKRSYVVNTQSVQQEATATALYLAGTARLPLGEQFALNARLGVARSKVSGTNVLPKNASLIGSKTGVMYGVGAEYRFTPKLAATLDYDYLPKTSTRLRTAMISLGVKVGF
jgi:OmpA-OmpF porin, OOP family